MKELTCNIINDNSYRTVSDIRGNQTSKSFLSSGIPKLKTDSFIIKEHWLRNEVNSNSWLFCILETMIYLENYVIFSIKSTIYKSVNYGSFSNWLISQKHQFVFSKIVRWGTLDVCSHCVYSNEFPIKI